MNPGFENGMGYFYFYFFLWVNYKPLFVTRKKNIISPLFSIYFLHHLQNFFYLFIIILTFETDKNLELLIRLMKYLEGVERKQRKKKTVESYTCTRKYLERIEVKIK